MTTPGPRRSPRFALPGKPVYVHLPESERAALEYTARAQNRSLSSMARTLLLAAMREPAASGGAGTHAPPAHAMQSEAD